MVRVLLAAAAQQEEGETEPEWQGFDEEGGDWEDEEERLEEGEEGGARRERFVERCSRPV